MTPHRNLPAVRVGRDNRQAMDFVPPPEPWMEQALCAQVDTEVFFPLKGGSTREPKQLCRLCDVRDDCLRYALVNDERFGIWGGMSERERRKLRRRPPLAELPEAS